MNEAFTVRVRTRDGKHFLWLAPAGGMGLSSPCCAPGHGHRLDAVTCGLEVLRQRFSTHVTGVA